MKTTLAPDDAHRGTVQKRLGSAVVIATRNRPAPLKACLASLATQSLTPHAVVIVDSSDATETQDLVAALAAEYPLHLVYIHTDAASAAGQRNLGAEQVDEDLVFFLDDDVVLEPAFIAEIVKLFEDDPEGQIGGVSGTIVNTVFVEPRGINRLLLGACVGQFRETYAGKVLGPAVNFLPADAPGSIQRVDWLPSTACAYRTAVFRSHRFGDTFEGYSFAEDLHLSSRVAQTHRLMNTSRARLFHDELGASSHKDWAAIGESMVVNRHMIMTTVLGKTRFRDHCRLVFYEVVYCNLAFLAAGMSYKRFQIAAQMLRGKLRGFVKILGPHRLLA